MEVSDAAAQDTPGQVGLWAAFLGTVHEEIVGSVDGRLGAQHAAVRGERLVIQLDRVAVQPVFGLDPIRWTFQMSRAEPEENVHDDSATETLVHARVQGADG
jgi:hypothetical protein